MQSINAFLQASAILIKENQSSMSPSLSWAFLERHNLVSSTSVSLDGTFLSKLTSNLCCTLYFLSYKGMCKHEHKSNPPFLPTRLNLSSHHRQVCSPVLRTTLGDQLLILILLINVCYHSSIAMALVLNVAEGKNRKPFSHRKIALCAYISTEYKMINRNSYLIKKKAILPLS